MLLHLVAAMPGGKLNLLCPMWVGTGDHNISPYFWTVNKKDPVPVGSRARRKTEPPVSHVRGDTGGRMVTTISPAQVGCHEQDVTTKLDKVLVTTTKIHLLISQYYHQLIFTILILFHEQLSLVQSMLSIFNTTTETIFIRWLA